MFPGPFHHPVHSASLPAAQLENYQLDIATIWKSDNQISSSTTVNMQSSRFHAITARFSAHNIRTSFRRSSSTSSRASSNRGSFSSQESSPVSTINSIIFRQPSLVDLEEERKSFGPELNLLEPRPVLFYGSMEERMGSF